MITSTDTNRTCRPRGAGLLRGLREGMGLATEMVFPVTCSVCGVGIRGDSGSPWCAEHAREMADLVGEEYCFGCGRSTGPYEREWGLCLECRKHPRRAVAGLARVGPHEGALQRLVADFKFRRAPTDRLLGELVADAVRGASWSGTIDALVPVPLHWRRRMERKHDPPRSLAKAVERQLALPLVPVLRRTRYTRPQVGLPRSERVANVRGSMRVVPAARITGLTLCLIDDVATTTATLREAARCLRRAGATKVYAAVVTKSESTNAY